MKNNEELSGDKITVAEARYREKFTGLKTLLKTLLPPSLRPDHLIRTRLRKRTGGEIVAGPFRGMKLGPILQDAGFDCAFMLGTFEQEISLHVVEALAENPDVIINVGAADGYYAVGLALKAPNAKVIAFEMDDASAEQMLVVAELNGVSENVERRGECTPVSLADSLEGAQRPFILCDVEGYEKILLDLEQVPALAQTYMLIEVHEGIVPGIIEEIETRFKPTHQVTRLPQRPRSLDDIPVEYRSFLARTLPAMYVEATIREPRLAADSWMWMRPKSS